MKLKKLFALALAVCMMVSVMPTSFAGNGFLSLDGVQPTTTTSGPSLTLDTPGTVSGGSVTTPSVSQSSQSVYTPYVYSNPYGVSSVADEGDGEGETTPAAPKANDTEVLSEGSEGNAEQIPNTIYASMIGSASGTVAAENLAPSNNEYAVGSGKVTTSKTATQEADGTYTLNLSVASSSVLQTTGAPCNIVLVLDASQTMKEGDKATKLQGAITDFITTVAQKSPGSKIAVVSYATSAQQHTGTSNNLASALVPVMTVQLDGNNKPVVDANGNAIMVQNPALIGTADGTVVGAVNAVANRISTNTEVGKCSDVGLEMAAGILQTTEKNENGVSDIVIFFTDGIPRVDYNKTTSLWTDNTNVKLAQKSIHWGTIIKGEKGTSIKIDESQGFYNDNSECKQSEFSDSTGCGAKLFCVGINLESYSGASSVGSSINEFLYRLSSHRKTGSHVGNDGWRHENTWEEDNDSILGAYLSWLSNYPDQYTRNIADKYPGNTSYYLVGALSSLGDHFKEITNEVGASVSGATIREYIPAYMQVDESKLNGGTLKTDDAGNQYVEWTASISPTSGFNKEINVQFKDGFLGGDGVTLNSTKSGVYTVADAAAPTYAFPVPSVDVDVQTPAVSAAVRNHYLPDTLTSNEMLYAATITLGGKKLDVSQEDLGLDPWQYAYVKRIELTPSAEMAADGTYNVTCAVTYNDDTVKEHTGSATFNVFKPHITFNDSTIYLGNWAYFKDNHADNCVVWKNANGLASDATDDDGNKLVTMTGDEPSVTVKYNQATGYFDGCKDISVKTVELGGTEVALRDVTFENDDDENANHHFTVHVLYPSVNYQNSTVHLGFAPTAAYHKANNLVSAGKFITWADKNTDHGIASETGNDDSSFNYSFTPVDTALTECTPVTATITVKTLPNVTADEDKFTVHVVRPTITFADQVIYLSKQPDYITLSDPDEVSAFGWNNTCVNNLEICKKDSITEVTGAVAPAAFAIDYDKLETDAFLDCTPVNATVKFGSGEDAPDYTEYVTLKNSADADDVQRGNNTHEFTVHVLKPDFAVSGTDLYADYGTELGLEYKKEDQDYQAIAWSNEWKCSTESCEDVKNEKDFIGDDADKATVSQVVYDVAHTPENAGVLTQDPDTKKWSYTVKTDDDNFTVELKEFKIGNITYDSENWAGVTYDGGATNDQAAFTIYVNKFQLTIKTDWTESSGEQQSAIFTVTPDNADLMPIKVVVPKGVNSVVVAGLFCGQKYTIAEDDDWTWRYGTAADAVYGNGEDRIACVGGLSLNALNGTDEVTMSFDDGDTYNPKWLADEACVVNKLNKNGVAVARPVRTKEDYEEVTNA